MTPTRNRLTETEASRSSHFILRLVESAEAMQAGRREHAQRLLRKLLHDTSPSGDARQRVAHVFTHSLLARLEGDDSGTGNLYQGDLPLRDMLTAFQTLVEATPLIRFGYQSANRMLLTRLHGSEAVHLIDIGIGSGTQWLSFLDALAARGERPRLHLTGIDVPARDAEERLRRVGENLGVYADRLGIPCTFEPIVALVEEMDADDFGVRSGETLAVNAVFALHHVPTREAGQAPTRDLHAVLRRLAGLRPHVLTLVEPDVEHNDRSFTTRVCESFVHYLLVFDALAKLLHEHPEQRAILEQTFFAREIHNVMVGEGTQRIERHARHQSWRERLEQEGFAALDCAPLVEGMRNDLALQEPISLTADREILVLSWRQQPWIAASAWAPRAASA